MTATTTRLHITPMTPDTSAALLPAHILPAVSFHTLLTFPERSYAFVTLPAADAESLKRKLNASMFRGQRVAISDARVEARLQRDESDPCNQAEEPPSQKSNKSGREEGVFPGWEIVSGRKVKRGWNEKGGECLFIAGIPANKTDIPFTSKESKDRNESKKIKKEKRRDKKRKRILKEFENTTKFPEFLKVSQLDNRRGKKEMVGAFVEGIGWVDAKGHVVEKDKKGQKTKQIQEVKEDKVKMNERNGKKPLSAEVTAILNDDELVTSTALGSSKSSSEDERAEAGAPQLPVELDMKSKMSNKSINPNTLPSRIVEINDRKPKKSSADSAKDKYIVMDNSNERDSRDSDEESNKISTPVLLSMTKTSASSNPSPALSSASEAESSTAEIATPLKPTTKPLKPKLKIHPLEALYKPTITTAASATSNSSSTFKFGFATHSSDAGSDTGSNPDLSAQTPLRSPSRYRSVAPTPDTAIGTKRFFSPSSPAAATSPLQTAVAAALNTGDSAPLIFPHNESSFLKGLTVWQRIPRPKGLTQQFQTEGDGNENAEVGVNIEGDMDVVEVWKRRFYQNRGDWNREWKRRRREGLKAVRKREKRTAR